MTSTMAYNPKSYVRYSSFYFIISAPPPKKNRKNSTTGLHDVAVEVLFKSFCFRLTQLADKSTLKLSLQKTKLSEQGLLSINATKAN